MIELTVGELCEALGAKTAAGAGGLCREVRGCYIGDLLSLAMSRVGEGDAWITIQTNINVVAVSALGDAACVIMCDGKSPDETCAKKADEEEIPILTSPDAAYALTCKICALGI